jgi:hypothetical protein
MMRAPATGPQSRANFTAALEACRRFEKSKQHGIIEEKLPRRLWVRRIGKQGKRPACLIEV